MDHCSCSEQGLVTSSDERINIHGPRILLVGIHLRVIFPQAHGAIYEDLCCSIIYEVSRQAGYPSMEFHVQL